MSARLYRMHDTTHTNQATMCYLTKLLTTALRRRDFEEFRKLVGKMRNVNAIIDEETGFTLLMKVIFECTAEDDDARLVNMLKVLLENPFLDERAEDSTKRTALQLAIETNRPWCVSTVLDSPYMNRIDTDVLQRHLRSLDRENAHADVLTKLKHKMHLCIAKNELAVTIILHPDHLQALKFSLETGLVRADASLDKIKMRWLFEGPADGLPRPKNLLHVAIRCRNFPAAHVLLDHLPQLADGMALLHACNNNVKVGSDQTRERVLLIKRLVDISSVDVHSLDKYERDALDHLSINGCQEAAMYILLSGRYSMSRRGATVCTNKFGNDFVEELASRIVVAQNFKKLFFDVLHRSQIMVLSQLLKLGVNPNVKVDTDDDDGKLPLCVVAASRFREWTSAVACLMDHRETFLDFPEFVEKVLNRFAFDQSRTTLANAQIFARAVARNWERLGARNRHRLFDDQNSHIGIRALVQEKVLAMGKMFVRDVVVENHRLEVDPEKSMTTMMMTYCHLLKEETEKKETYESMLSYRDKENKDLKAMVENQRRIIYDLKKNGDGGGGAACSSTGGGSTGDGGGGSSDVVVEEKKEDDNQKLLLSEIIGSE